jgi:hypothetical protein
LIAEHETPLSITQRSSRGCGQAEADEGWDIRGTVAAGCYSVPRAA